MDFDLNTNTMPTSINSGGSLIEKAHVNIGNLGRTSRESH